MKRILKGVLISSLFSLMMITGCATLNQTKGVDQESIKNSPQWRDGKFRNNLPRKRGSIWKILGQQFKRHKNRVPNQPIPIVKKGKKDFLEFPKSGLRITWLGHSTVLLEIDGKRLLTDPIWSKRGSPISFIGPKRFFTPPISIDELPNIDVVVISHNHYDHLDKKTIKKLKHKTKHFAVPLGIGRYLKKWGVLPNKIQECDWWSSVRLGELTLTATPARHFSGRSIINIYKDDTLWSGWAIQGPKHNVFFSGDTAMFPEFSDIGNRLGPFDLTLFEIGAYNKLWPDVHIGPEQAVTAHQMVKGKVMMPIHWGTFNLAMHSWIEPAERLIKASKNKGIVIYIPIPGESVEPTHLSDFKKWWPDGYWENAEKNPIMSTGIKGLMENDSKTWTPSRRKIILNKK